MRAEAGFNDIGVIFSLKNALHPAVRNEASRRLPSPIDRTPASYELWKSVVLQVDHDLRTNATDAAFFTGDPFGPRRWTPGYAPWHPVQNMILSTPGPSAISPAATSISSTGMTNQVASTSHAPRSMHCWNYSKTGHISKDCKKKCQEKTQAVLDSMDNVELMMENVRHMMENALEDADNTEVDSEVFSCLMAELPQFFVESSKKIALLTQF